LTSNVNIVNSKVNCIVTFPGRLLYLILFHFKEFIIISLFWIRFLFIFTESCILRRSVMTFVQLEMTH